MRNFNMVDKSIENALVALNLELPPDIQINNFGAMQKAIIAFLGSFSFYEDDELYVIMQLVRAAEAK